ncbi:hypothetical protein [Rhizobium sp. 18055]|uniref:hypothetical protein n=1 Tax=Rhizobium sp. 18055 TaxID=2681403 RepID=UPI0013570B1C|nr:hypothetical protein [Rhizobium sp. 18055]
MKKFRFEVTQTIHVHIDENKLAPLMDEFNQSIRDYGVGDGAIEQHAERIARLAAQGYDFDPSDFVEGYGVVRDAGISIVVENTIDVEKVGA